MKTRWLSVVSLFLLSLGAAAQEQRPSDLSRALEADPAAVLDFLRAHRKEVFEILNQYLVEEDARQRAAAEEAARREFEEALASPKTPAIDASTRVRGNRGARHTIVTYSDFQCPYCVRAFETVEALRAKLGADVRIVFRNLPLETIHPQALPAARWFEAATLQSEEKAWLFHDRLFANQQRLGEDFYRETARELGLDVGRLERDARGKHVEERIAADLAEAARFGFTGTPAFLIDGVPVRGAKPLEELESILRRSAAARGETRTEAR